MNTVVAAIILLAYAVLAFKNRTHALIILVATLPLYLIRFSVGPLPSTVLEGMICILFLFWLIFEKRFLPTVATFFREKKTFALSVCVFLLAATISIFVSPDIRAAVSEWRAYFIEPALVFLVAIDRIRTKTDLRHIFDASIASAAIIGAIAVYQRFTGWHIPPPWLSELRVTSIYPYPNAVGLYLAPIISMVVVRLFDTIRERAHFLRVAIYVGVFLLLFVAVYFAKTEAALVALAVVLPLMGFIWSNRTRIATIAICLSIVGIIFSSPPLVSSIQEKLLLKDWSGEVRQVIWEESRSMLADHTVFGAGLAGYQKTMAPYHKAKFLEIFLFPHTIVLNFWSETGLLGVVSFFAIVVVFFFTLVTTVRRKNADEVFTRMFSLSLFGAMTIFLIHGLVDVPYFKNDLAVFFWLLLAQALCVERLSQMSSKGAKSIQ